jgi:hypothetical protein
MGKMFRVACLFALLAFVFCGCQSRKGDYIQVLYEAKQFEKSIKDLRSVPDHKFLNELIDKVAADGKSRWRVSANPKYLLETTKAYMDYRDRSRWTKCFYCVASDGTLILVDE